MAKKQTELLASTPVQNRAPKAVSSGEIGVSGLKQSNGYIFEEFIPELTGDRGIRKYREMSENDATVGAMLVATSSILRPLKWKVESSEKDTDDFYADWAQSVIFEDMETKFEDFMAEILTFLSYGFSLFEVVYKIRRDGQSLYNDGKIGIKVISPRPQDTICRWDLDDKGRVLGVYQTSYNYLSEIYIPASKLLHFRTTSNKENPLGKSILRNAYKSYVYLQNIQTIEAIAIEREMSGLPLIRVPSEVLTNPEYAATKELYTSIARDLKMGHQGGIVIPSNPFEDMDGKMSNIRQVDVELITSSGKRLIDMDAVIHRYQRDIARSILADFLMLGTNDRGSFAMSKDKTNLFLVTLETFTRSIASTLNRNLMVPLWKLNGFDMEMMPTLKPAAVTQADLEQLGNFVKALSTAGIGFGDEDTVKTLRRAADLPEVVEEPYVPPSNNNSDPAKKDNTGDSPKDKNKKSDKKT